MMYTFAFVCFVYSSSPFPTSFRLVSSDSQHVVLVGLDDCETNACRCGIATMAGVPCAHVTWYDQPEGYISRRLLSDSHHTIASIKAANESAADEITFRLTVEKIQAGQPGVTVIVAAFRQCQLAAVDLGGAAPFAVLAKTSVTVAMGSQVSGFMGTCHNPNDDTAKEGCSSSMAALLDIHSRSECLTDLQAGADVELGRGTLPPGLYASHSPMISKYSLALLLLTSQICAAKLSEYDCLHVVVL